MNKHKVTVKHPGSVNTDGFDQEALRITAIEKIGELKAESGQREKEAMTKEGFAYWVLNNVQEYSASWFYASIYLYCLESARDSFRLWLKYWKRVGGLYKKPKFNNSISDQDIQRAREFPVQELVGEFRRSGSKLFVHCPFHDEKTPSLCVYPDNSWHCFGCNKHGNNAIDFLEQKEDLSFKEAIRRLI